MSESSGRSPLGGALAIELQMRQEAASALKAAGRALEELLKRLELLRPKALSATGAAQATLRAEYQELFKQAEYRKWCLIVQREAMGLRHHGELDLHYALPPPLPSGGEREGREATPADSAPQSRQE